MSWALAASATIAAASATGSAYPIELTLTEARSICGTVLAGADVDETLMSAGWMPVQPQPGSWIAKEVKEKWEAVGTPHREFSKVVSGRTLFLIFGTDPDERLTQTLCVVQDPDAVLQSDVTRVVHWAGKEPVAPPFVLPKLDGLDDVGFVKRWRPGLSEEADETMINYSAGFGLKYFAVRYEEGTVVQ